MIGLGDEELVQRLERRHNGGTEDACLIQLFDVGLGDAFLVVVCIKNRRSILSSDIIALPVQSRGVVGDREVNLQQLTVSYLTRIVDNLDHLRMVGGSAANGLVVRGFGCTTGVTGSYGFHPAQFEKHGFNTPEASPGQDRDLPHRACSNWRIYNRIGKVGNRNSAAGHILHSEDASSLPPRRR